MSRGLPAKGVKVDHRRNFLLLRLGKRLDINLRTRKAGFLGCEKHEAQTTTQFIYRRGKAFEYGNRRSNASGIVQCALCEIMTVVVRTQHNPFRRLARNLSDQVQPGCRGTGAGNLHACPRRSCAAQKGPGIEAHSHCRNILSRVRTARTGDQFVTWIRVHNHEPGGSVLQASLIFQTAVNRLLGEWVFVPDDNYVPADRIG